jgi:hypothetical protein
VHCVADNPNARSNGAFLTAAYVVLRHGRSAQQAFAPLLGIYPPIAPFRDASYGLSDFTITVLDCLKSLCRALSCNMLHSIRFDSESYTHYSRVENGDWNWLVVDQLIAFSGPMNERRYVIYMGIIIILQKYYFSNTSKAVSKLCQTGVKKLCQILHLNYLLFQYSMFYFYFSCSFQRTCFPRRPHYVDESKNKEMVREGMLGVVREEGYGAANGAARGAANGAGESSAKSAAAAAAVSSGGEGGESKVMLSASDYAHMLGQHGVTEVIRLNDPSTYDSSYFTGEFVLF